MNIAMSPISKLVQVILLWFILTAESDVNLFESVSINSGEGDSTGIEKLSYTYYSGKPQLDLTGRLRQTMVYHMALTDTRRSAICSPISALLPLGKLAMGSSSRQFTELKNAIGHGRYSVTSKFKSLMSRLQSISGKVQLIVASRLFVPKSGQLRSEFHNRVMSVFKSSCERVDFGEPQRTAASINNWVKLQTKGLIKKIITPSEISSKSSLIITNAIYFNGRWKHRFTSVKYDTFYGTTSMRSIQMMTIERGYQYARSSRLRAEIVQIPYAGNEVSFIAVLPYEKDGLGHLMRQLLQSPKELNNALAKLSLAYMRLSLPKFKIQSNLDLGAIYFKVGLKEIFKNNNKILTKILKGRNVFVSKSVQAAVIELSEYGTEAAGATFVEIQKISAPQFIDVNFNRPFLFYILAGSDQLFGGIFTNS